LAGKQQRPDSAGGTRVTADEILEVATLAAGLLASDEYDAKPPVEVGNGWASSERTFSPKAVDFVKRAYGESAGLTRGAMLVMDAIESGKAFEINALVEAARNADAGEI
jgi:hypothetical protein